MVKNTLVFGIILLFIVSAVSPMVIGLKSDTVDVEIEELLDNLAFYCYDEYDSSKSEYYKEYFQRDNLEIADLEEITIPVELPQTSVSSGPMDSPWPMFGHDTRHTGRSTYNTTENFGYMKWIYETDLIIETSPVIDNNGTLYIASWNELYAINPNGTEKWSWQNWELESSSPALAEDGTIYIGANNGKLYAINPDGTEKWSFLASGGLRAAPTVGEDGTVYFGTFDENGMFYAINPNGTEKWHYEADFFVQSSPAIGSDGTIYFASHVSLYSFYPNGTLKWRNELGSQNFLYLGGPSIGDDDIIYIPRMPGPLFAIWQNGTKKWECEIDWGSSGTPSISLDGTIYIGYKHFYAINPNGTRKWTFIPDEYDYHNIDSRTYAISKDGTIYFGTVRDGSAFGYLIALDPDGTEKWRQWIHNERVLSSPIIGDDGTVYIGAQLRDDSNFPIGHLYAFGKLDPNAPEAPDISGEIEGVAGEEYEYTFSTTDPNGDDVYFNIEWGDGEFEDWFGPYDSGEEVVVSHIWDEQDTYTIRARAKDTDNLWGSWGELEVSMPVSQHAYSFPLLQRLLELFPNAFPILRFLLTK